MSFPYSSPYSSPYSLPSSSPISSPSLRKSYTAKFKSDVLKHFDRYGNSPLLYALKRNSSTKVGWICEYMSAYPKLVAEVTNVELCLLFKIGP